MEYSGDQGQNDMPMRGIVADVDGTAWKYIHTHNDIDELYDVTSDPAEKNSLTQSPDHQPIRRDLRRRLGEWMRETGDFATPGSPDEGA